MTKAIAKTYETAAPYRAYVTILFFVGACAAAMWYATSLYQVISRTVALQHVNNQNAVISSAVDALDSQYISLSSSESLQNLGSYGLEAGQVTAYIPRSAPDTSVAALYPVSSVAFAGHEL